LSGGSRKVFFDVYAASPPKLVKLPACPTRIDRSTSNVPIGLGCCGRRDRGAEFLSGRPSQRFEALFCENDQPRSSALRPARCGSYAWFRPMSRRNKSGGSAKSSDHSGHEQGPYWVLALLWTRARTRAHASSEPLKPNPGLGRPVDITAPGGPRPQCRVLG